MKAKAPASSKKPTVVVKDLKAKKNPKGGAGIIVQTPGTIASSAIKLTGANTAIKWN